MTFSIKKIDNPNFYLAFSERSGRNPKDNSQLTLVVGGDYDWLFYHDPNYPDEMEIYQYPLSICAECYTECSVEEFNDPKQRDEIINKIEAGLEAEIEDYYTTEPPLSADERWQQAYDQKMELKS